MERLKRGNEVLKQRMTSGTKSEIRPETLRRIKRYDTMMNSCDGQSCQITKENLFFLLSTLTSSQKIQENFLIVWFPAGHTIACIPKVFHA